MKSLDNNYFLPMLHDKHEASPTIKAYTNNFTINYTVTFNFRLIGIAKF